MNRLPLVVLAQGLIIIALAAAVTWFGRDEFAGHEQREEEEIVAASRAEVEGGRPIVRLAVAAQRASGIATAPLEAARYTGSMALQGSVADAAPLIEARLRLLAAQAELPVLRAELAQREREAERLVRLNRDERNVSDRAAEAAQAEVAALRARIAGAEQQVQGVLAALRAQWGEALAKRVAGDDGQGLEELAAGRAVLLEVALPPGQRKAPARVTAASVSDPATGVDAKLLAPAPRQSAQAPGATWYYLAPGESLRVGQRVTAQAETRGQREGVLLPGAALVWYGGRAWAYVQEEDDEFARRPVDTRHELGTGWFVDTGFAPGDKVVIEGAQLLLSEEFKYQITNENED